MQMCVQNTHVCVQCVMWFKGIYEMSASMFNVQEHKLICTVIRGHKHNLLSNQAWNNFL